MILRAGLSILVSVLTFATIGVFGAIRVVDQNPIYKPNEKIATSDCTKLIQNNNTEFYKNDKTELSENEQSYLRIIETLTQKKLISHKDIEKILSELKNLKLTNPLANKTLNAESLPYKKTLDKLLLRIKNTSQILFNELTQLITKYELKENNAALISKQSELILSPKLLSRLINNDLFHTSPTIFTTKDGRTLIAAGTRKNKLYIADMSQLDTPKRIKINGSASCAPVYFSTKNGEEYLMISTLEKSLYIFNINNLENPIKIKTRSLLREPIFLTTDDGRELIAAGDNERHLNIYDFNDLKNPIYIHTPGNVLHATTYTRTDDGTEALAAGTDASNGLLIELAATYKIHAYNFNAHVSAHTKYFMNQQNQSVFASGGMGTTDFHILNVSDQNKYQVESTMRTNAYPSFISRKNNKDYVNIFSWTSVLYYLNLNDSTDFFKLKLNHEAMYSPTYIQAPDGREIVIASDSMQQLYVFDLTDHHNPHIIKLSSIVNSDISNTVTADGNLVLAFRVWTHNETNRGEINIVTLYSKSAQRDFGK